jgi:hypothetical protein
MNQPIGDIKAFMIQSLPKAPPLHQKPSLQHMNTLGSTFHIQNHSSDQSCRNSITQKWCTNMFYPKTYKWFAIESKVPLYIKPGGDQSDLSNVIHWNGSWRKVKCLPHPNYRATFKPLDLVTVSQAGFQRSQALRVEMTTVSLTEAKEGGEKLLQDW